MSNEGIVKADLEKKPAFTLKETLDLAFALSNRIHNTWSLYIGSALAVIGWLVTHPSINLNQKCVLSAAFAAATYASTTTLIVLNRYMAAVILEAQEAAKSVEFRVPTSEKLVKGLGAISGWVVFVINAALLIMTLLLIWFTK